MAFYQVLASLGTTYSVKLPEHYTKWMNVFQIFSFRLDELLGVPAGCIASDLKSVLLINSLTPWLVIAVAFAAFTLHQCCKMLVRRHRKHGGEQPAGSVRGALVNGMLATGPFALLVTFSFVPSVSATIFQAWACVGYGITETEKRYFLRKDLSIECHTSDAHKDAKVIAYIMMLLWPVGVLLLYMALLRVARWAIINRTPNRIFRAIAFLHKGEAALATDCHPTVSSNVAAGTRLAEFNNLARGRKTAKILGSGRARGAKI